MAVTIYPVIMAGGAGTRLWPLSTSQHPKQFQPLLGDRSPFQETVSRVTGSVGEVRFAEPSVIGGVAYRDQINEQLAAMGATPHQVVLEPFGRNTAAVAALAAALPDDETGLVLLLPSDHHMSDSDAFRRAVSDAAPGTLSEGLITTFGIEPTHPETGYGYILRGQPIDGNLCRCEAFVEKPDLETAQRYLADGRYAWNGGIFLFPASVMRDELAAHAPDIQQATLAALQKGASDGPVRILDPDTFETCPSDSVDYAVMERTQRAAVYGPLRCGWSDIGSWAALADLDTSMARGDVVAIDTQNSYLRSDDGTMIAAIGLEGYVVVASGGSVLIVPKNRAQDVKHVVNRLKDESRSDKL